MSATATEIRLADCVDLLAGFAFKSDRFQDAGSGGVPLVKGENIGQGRILWDISRYWPSNEDGLDKFRLLPGDVVLAMDRPWVPAGLKWAVIRDGDPDAFLVQRCARLRTRSPDLRQDFLRYVIGGPGFEAYIRPITTGVNVPHISGAQILGYNFRLPPVEEQKRIAGILSAYDDLIENCERRIRALDEMARSLYREWFVDFRLGDRWASSPTGWESKSVKEVAAVQYGMPFKSALFTDDGTVGKALVRIRDVPAGQSFTYTPEPADPRYEIHEGDVLVGMDGDFHMTVWNGGPALLNQRVARFRARGNWSPLHLFLLLQEPIARLNRSIVGTTVAHLGDSHIREIMVLLPPEALLRAAFQTFEPMRLLSASLAKRVRNLRATRDLLLPRLLSGQLSVDDAA